MQRTLRTRDGPVVPGHSDRRGRINRTSSCVVSRRRGSVPHRRTLSPSSCSSSVVHRPTCRWRSSSPSALVFSSCRKRGRARVTTFPLGVVFVRSRASRRCRRPSSSGRTPDCCPECRDARRRQHRRRRVVVVAVVRRALRSRRPVASSVVGRRRPPSLSHAPAAAVASGVSVVSGVSVDSGVSVASVVAVACQCFRRLEAFPSTPAGMPMPSCEANAPTAASDTSDDCERRRRSVFVA